MVPSPSRPRHVSGSWRTHPTQKTGWDYGTGLGGPLIIECGHTSNPGVFFTDIGRCQWSQSVPLFQDTSRGPEGRIRDSISLPWFCSLCSLFIFFWTKVMIRLLRTIRSFLSRGNCDQSCYPTPFSRTIVRLTFVLTIWDLHGCHLGQGMMSRFYGGIDWFDYDVLSGSWVWLSKHLIIRQRSGLDYQSLWPTSWHCRLLVFPVCVIIIGEDSFVITSRQRRIDWCLQCVFQGLVHGPFLENIMLFSSWKEDSLYPVSRYRTTMELSPHPNDIRVRLVDMRVSWQTPSQ